MTRLLALWCRWVPKKWGGGHRWSKPTASMEWVSVDDKTMDGAAIWLKRCRRCHATKAVNRRKPKGA